MDELLDWLVAVLEARAVPAAGVITGIGVLRECLGENDSAAAGLLERGAAPSALPHASASGGGARSGLSRG